MKAGPEKAMKPEAADKAMQKQRVVTISAICLLDDDACRTEAYVADMIGQAARRGRHDLIVVPLTPFLSFREGREEQDLAVFSSLAREHGTYLAVAAAEKAGDGRAFYASVLLDRDGRFAGKYRKTHALPDDAVALGDDLPVFKTDFGVLGFSLGTDFYFPEVYAVESMKGADILVWQDYTERFREHFQWIPLLKARPVDSRAHMVAAMYADPRCYLTNRYREGVQGVPLGQSMILNRVGVPVANTGYEDGVATAIVNLDRRKADPHEPYRRDENIFLVNNEGDRKAFHPLSEPWQPPALPAYRKRQGRIAVGYFFNRDEDQTRIEWMPDNLTPAMFEVLDKAAALKPDLVLLSEMAAREATPTTAAVAEMVAERARRMNAYILIGGLDIDPRPAGVRSSSHAILWDRSGNRVFKEKIYWPRGFPEIKVFDTDFARIGVHLCGDLYVGEVDRVLTLKGAEIILDPSRMWGGDGHNNELMLRARAVDNGCWVACSHWNSSDPGLRSVIVDPYGCVMAASKYQESGAIGVDIDFDVQKVYYAGRKPKQAKRGTNHVTAYINEDIPEQIPGWRSMILARRRPELYGILPTTNEVTRRLFREKK